MSLLEQLLSYSDTKSSMCLNFLPKQQNIQCMDPLLSRILHQNQNSQSVRPRFISVDRTNPRNNNLKESTYGSKSIEKYKIDWTGSNRQQQVCRSLLRVDRIVQLKIRKKLFQFWVNLTGPHLNSCSPNQLKYQRNVLSSISTGLQQINNFYINHQTKQAYQYGVLETFQKIHKLSMMKKKAETLMNILSRIKKQLLSIGLQKISQAQNMIIKREVFVDSISLIYQQKVSRCFGLIKESTKKQISVSNVKSNSAKQIIIVFDSIKSPQLPQQQAPLTFSLIPQQHSKVTCKLIPDPVGFEFHELHDRNLIFLENLINETEQQQNPSNNNKSMDETINSFTDFHRKIHPKEPGSVNMRKVIQNQIQDQICQNRLHSKIMKLGSRTSSISFLDEQRVQRLEKRVFGGIPNIRQLSIPTHQHNFDQRQYSTNDQVNRNEPRRSLWEQFRPPILNQLLESQKQKKQRTTSMKKNRSYPKRSKQNNERTTFPNRKKSCKQNSQNYPSKKHQSPLNKQKLIESYCNWKSNTGHRKQRGRNSLIYKKW